MTGLIPPIPLAALLMATGALGGVAGTHALAGPPDPVRVAAPAPAPSAQAALVDEGARGPHQVRRAGDGMFYVRARINGRPVRFLVDTGASVVVLTAADARAVGATTGSYARRLRTAGGSAAMAWTRLDEVVVGGRRVTHLPAAVVRNGPGVSLLGADLLSRLGPVRIEGDRLEIG